MSLDISAAIQTEIDASDSMPINLVEFYLDAGTIRKAAEKTSVIFPTGGNTYTPLGFIVGNKKVSQNGQMITIEYNFDDREGVLWAYNQAEPFKGKQFVHLKVYANQLGISDNYIERINGSMDEPIFDKEIMILRITDGRQLNFRSINDQYQKPCNHVFGDEFCNYDGYADLTSLTAIGTADSGSATTLVDSALTQADDYWNYGEIIITIDGNEHRRKVKDFVAASDTITFDVALPVAVSNGDSYTVYKGCSKTWEACQANYNYGPSSDNKANFLGFIHLLSKGGSQSVSPSGVGGWGSGGGGGGGYRRGPPQDLK